MKACLCKMLILLSGLFVSCNDMKQSADEGEPSVSVNDGGISSVEASEEVVAFFSEYLSGEYGYGNDIGFPLGEKTECLVIDSMDEFRAVAPAGVELPEIDFDNYTLIIGCMCAGEPSYDFVSQKIHVESDRMILIVEYRYNDGIALAVEVFYTFWGLYPKLPEGEVELDLRVI